MPELDRRELGADLFLKRLEPLHELMTGEHRQLPEGN